MTVWNAGPRGTLASWAETTVRQGEQHIQTRLVPTSAGSQGVGVPSPPQGQRFAIESQNSRKLSHSGLQFLVEQDTD